MNLKCHYWGCVQAPTTRWIGRPNLQFSCNLSSSPCLVGHVILKMRSYFKTAFIIHEPKQAFCNESSPQSSFSNSHTRFCWCNCNESEFEGPHTHLLFLPLVPPLVVHFDRSIRGGCSLEHVNYSWPSLISASFPEEVNPKHLPMECT